MKLVLIGLIACLTNVAFASDHWDYCSSADGYVKMEGGVLMIQGVGEIASESVKVKVLKTIRTEEEKCILKGYNTEVIAYDNTITVEEVTYTVEENDMPSKVVLLCERGGSGIPAEASCK
jgi:hypothetical protein